MRYSVNTQASQWRIVDGEAVVVNVNSSYYYGLNRSGTLVWSLLAEGAGRTLDEVARHLADAYGIDLDRATADAQTVIGQLVVEGLVEES